MLIISNLSVATPEQIIIKKLSLELHPGSLHALMGLNGSGKSTLAYTLMGHPRYQITEGSIIFNGVDITYLAPDKRAQLGIFLAFQYPYEIPGVTVFNFLKEACNATRTTPWESKEFHAQLMQAMEQLSMDPAFATRNVNEGFSGGEKKRLELLQILMLKPRLVILDEIDSGLDSDALKVVAQGLTTLRAAHPAMTLLVITHYQRMLHYVMPDHVHVMHHGALIRSGDMALAYALEAQGYGSVCNDEHVDAGL